ncbi:MAG: hypothetical protein JWM56_169 [Candidatus Peribacteria bacterium]|nr:hypothetical protein [Candidatus Peribacteria bacterium]
MDSKDIHIGCSLAHDFLNGKAELDTVRDAIRQRLENILQKHVGFAPASLTEGQAVSQIINQIVSEYGLRVAFPLTDEPARLAFKKVGNAKDPVFTILKDAKTASYHGKTLPQLKLVPVGDHGLRPLASSLRKK